MKRLICALICLALPAQAEVPIQDIKSPGGITAWLVEEPAIPFVALEIMFDGGAAMDPKGKAGAANLMMALLEEGAGDMDARAFAKRQEELSASFSFAVYDETISISARFLSENQGEALALLKTALTQPRFDRGALDRVRGQIAAVIQSNAKDPNEIASQTFDALAFGDHPYARPLTGTEDSLNGLSRQDMIDTHERLLVKDRMFVSAVGDITAGTLGRVLDDLLGDLPATSAASVPEVDIALKGGVTVVDLPTPQSVALFGHAGIDRDDPDFFPAFVLNTIIGGSGFNSRLMTEVREKRGLTYGIGTYLVDRAQADVYMGQVASANDRMAQAIEVIKSEWTRAATEGVTAEELETAKLYLTGAYPLRFDGNARIAGILVGMQRGGLPLSYIATRNDKVNAVTLQDINRVAANLMRTQDLHFVVVGQPAGLQ